MADNSFRIKNSLVLNPTDLTTLLSPQAGDLACDINDSNKIKRYDVLSASWVEVGSGAAGDVDTLLVQDFDSASLSSFTQTGLALITTNPLDGRQSARLIHQPLVGEVQSFKETLSVSPKFRGVNMTASLLIRSTASQGNVTIQFRDETNSVDYPSQQLQTNSQEIASLVTNSTTTVSGFSNSVINSLKVGMSVTGSGIPTGTTIASINSSALTIVLSQAATASATVSLRFSDLPRTIQLGFQIPANCSSYSYTISALQEAGLPETYIDDVVLKNYWLGMSNQGQSSTEIEVPIITDWVDFPMTIGATTTAPTKGATSVDKAQWRRVGSDMEIRYDFKQTSAGSAGSGIYLFPIPSAYTIDNSRIPSGSADQAIAGVAKLASSTDSAGAATAPASVLVSKNYPNRLYLNYIQSSVENTTPVGSAAYPLSGATLGISFTARVPISGWLPTETRSFITNDLVPAKAVLGNTAIDVPNITGWQGYTPTFQGFGTPSNVEFEWRQVGENVEIRGKFTSGTPTAVEARVGLPGGLTSAGTSLIPSLQTVGLMARDVNTSNPFSILVEPSVSYVTLGLYAGNSPLQKRLATELFSTSGITASFFASVPCSGLSATTTKTIPLTQSGLVQNADSYFRIGNCLATARGTTATNVVYFPDTPSESIGDAIQFLSDAANGSRWVAQKAGLYHFYFDMEFTATTNYAIVKNATGSELLAATDPLSIDATKILGRAYDNGANYVVGVEAVAYLQVGDIVRLHSNTNPAGTANGRQSVTVSYQGSLKQIAVSSDQKLRIPTSELRFEGASARGTGTEAGIVQFTSLAKLRGDAFEINNSNGTAITMKKAGKLSINTSLVNSAAQSFQITKNQSTRTSISSVSSEVLSTVSNATGLYVTLTADIHVQIGDIIRVAGNASPTSSSTNNLNLSFQEQDISVSVTNTLPQFSDSDTYFRLNGFSSLASTTTQGVRLSSVLNSTGDSVSYTDDAAYGATFNILETGTYDVSAILRRAGGAEYADCFITVNEITNFAGGAAATLSSIIARTSVASNTGDISNSTASVQVYLTSGDKVRVQLKRWSGSSVVDNFTISKVGKPNVTGVDVTPFVNVPQQDVQEIQSTTLTSTWGSTSTLIPVITINKNTNNGILSVVSSAATGTSFVALKKCTVNAGASFVDNASAGGHALIYLNSTPIMWSVISSANNYSSVNASIIMQPGDILTFQRSNTTVDSLATCAITATALSDQILTAPETFSTDTAALSYASSAAYTLSTLQNAPVGTYITFTYAANTNTRTQTTTPPNQSPADMNANGIRIFTRAYNAASTAGNPAAIAIQIGKGLKGKSLDLYKSVGKVTVGSLDADNTGNSSEQFYGMQFKDYDEMTGILYIDAGFKTIITTTSHNFKFIDLSNQTSGYLVINASKNPALTGLGLNRIAARATNTSGQTFSASDTIMTYNATKVFDTHNALNTSTGLFTAPESGYYLVEANAFFASRAYTAGVGIYIRGIKNGVYHNSGAINTITNAYTGNAPAGKYSSVVYLAKGDTFGVAVWNDAGTASLFTSISEFNSISITKVSV